MEDGSQIVVDCSQLWRYVGILFLECLQFGFEEVNDEELHGGGRRLGSVEKNSIVWLSSASFVVCFIPI